MVILALLFIGVLYTAMWFARTERSKECRWRQERKDEAGVAWRCAVCGARAQTVKDEPTFCGAKRD
ncbi:hypothetical protein [Celeribacter sp.]|uniref:hypothetical protein n=1 Tax=Celeribacter sp. TaxID=1890673 RepID=UPI003A950BA1